VSDYHGTSGLVRNASDWHADQRAWHQDGTADATFSPRVGLIRAIRAPSKGGDTLFACTRAIARRLLEREAAGEPLDPPPSLARLTYRRHQSSTLARDGVAIDAASGALTASHGPFPLIARDEPDDVAADAVATPLVIYNWNVESVMRPDGSQLSAEASWAYARALLEPELGAGATGVFRHTWRAGDLVLWDNWATIHTATAPCLYGDEERLMHRVRLRSARPPQPWSPVLPRTAGRAAGATD